MNKSITLSLLSVMLSAIVLSALASATVDFALTPNTIQFNSGATSTSFVVTNTGDNATFTLPSIATITSGTDTLTVSFNNNSFSLLTSATKTITASIISGSLADFDFGTPSTTINVTATDGVTHVVKTLTIKAVKSFCDFGDIGNLDIKSVDFTDNGLGEDNDWYLLDEVQVDVDVRNTGNDDIDNVILSWALVDKDSGEIIFDNEEDSIDIRDGDTETFSFTLAVDANDFNSDMLNDKIALFIKVFSDDVGEDLECNSQETSISLQIPGDFVALDEVQAPETVACGESFEITGNLWNIGDDDQRDVTVRISNSELGINKVFDAGDLDVLDEKKMRLAFQLPQNLTEKSYTIALSVLDSGGDVFENDDGDASESDVVIRVAGNCQQPTSSNVVLSTSLESEANAGEELTIKTTLRNAGSSTTTYSLSASGQDSWSTGLALSQSQVTLNAGESKDILITLTPNKDVSGDNQLTITAAFDGKTKAQNVVINVAKSSGFNFNLGGNWYLWLIIGINVILIIVIIVVAVSMSKK